MRSHVILKTDSAIYWQLAGENDLGEPMFLAPVIVKCRWDTVSVNTSLSDRVETQTRSSTIYPDRILVIGSYLMLGDENALARLASDDAGNPRRIKDAVMIKDQSTIAELRYAQTSYEPGFMSSHLTVECHT